MPSLPLPVQTLFVELAERVAAREAGRTVRNLSGSFVRKPVAGREYWYFKASMPGSGQHEFYLGANTPSLQRLIDLHREGRETESAEIEQIAQLCSMLRSGGATIVDSAAARVLSALSDAGVFRLGGVLVGTYSFLVMSNVLGVRWSGGTRTQDIDIAAAPRTRTVGEMQIALPAIDMDAPSILAGLDMGFLPVPGLDSRSPSTSFRVRGRELRVDFLTPAASARPPPTVPIPRLGVAASPLEMLGFLFEDTVQTVAVNGGAIALTVPDPARFALHKLVVAGRRAIAFQAKAAKDREQADQLLGWLHLERPGDIERAIEAAMDRHLPLAKRLARALRAARDKPWAQMALELMPDNRLTGRSRAPASAPATLPSHPRVRTRRP